jgi:hypothetical protein
MKLLPHVHMFSSMTTYSRRSGRVMPTGTQYECECGVKAADEEKARYLANVSEIKNAIALIAWLAASCFAFVLIVYLWHWSWS